MDTPSYCLKEIGCGLKSSGTGYRPWIDSYEQSNETSEQIRNISFPVWIWRSDTDSYEELSPWGNNDDGRCVTSQRVECFSFFSNWSTASSSGLTMFHGFDHSLSQKLQPAKRIDNFDSHESGQTLQYLRLDCTHVKSESDCLGAQTRPFTRQTTCAFP
jgi:hypothetical protein